MTSWLRHHGGFPSWYSSTNPDCRVIIYAANYEIKEHVAGINPWAPVWAKYVYLTPGKND